MPQTDHQPLSASSAADRQSALLSLLYPAATSLTAVAPQQQQQQIPTPPASGQSPSNSSETQGKILLEQLMAGCVPFLVQIIVTCLAQHTRHLFYPSPSLLLLPLSHGLLGLPRYLLY